MNNRMKESVLLFLLILAATMTAGSATAGKTTSQFAVTLTVASKCTVTTSARQQGGRAALGHGTRLAGVPITVAHCLHGGRLAVTTDSPPATGPALVDVANAGAGVIKAGAGKNALSRRGSAPTVVTVTF